jgi:invasion protein IalB
LLVLAEQQAPSRGAPPPAAAVPAPPPPPPAVREQSAGPRPDRTTATYGDWVLRCEYPSGGGELSCEVAQTILDQRGQALAQVTVRRAGATPSARLAVSVQVGASATVAEPLRLTIEDQPALTLPFRRCLPRGCFAEALQSDAELGGLARRAEAAKLEFRDGDGQAAVIPASLRGLAASVDAPRSAERG